MSREEVVRRPGGPIAEEPGRPIATWNASLATQRAALLKLRGHGEKVLEDPSTLSAFMETLFGALGMEDRRLRSTANLVCKAFAVLFSAADFLQMPICLFVVVVEATRRHCRRRAKCEESIAVVNELTWPQRGGVLNAERPKRILSNNSKK